jgi:hypothetical protein
MFIAWCRSARLVALILLIDVAAGSRAPAGSINETVLHAIQTVPAGGGYATDSATTALLGRATEANGSRLLLRPSTARPSYCSGATYLVFLRAIDSLIEGGQIRLDPSILSTLLVRGQADGEGVWGRWNANGPGTARLFYEAQLGRNFTDFTAAQPGDFMKIFWNKEVGRLERGHSVIFLGTERVDGKERVRFWSSNKPLGYGEKIVARSQIARAIFSRFEHPENLGRIAEIPRRDPYLASLLVTKSSFAEAEKKCGIE